MTVDRVAKFEVPRQLDLEQEHPSSVLDVIVSVLGGRPDLAAAIRGSDRVRLMLKDKHVELLYGEAPRREMTTVNSKNYVFGESAAEMQIKVREKSTNETRDMSVAEYFRLKHRYILRQPDLPMLKMDMGLRMDKSGKTVK